MTGLRKLCCCLVAAVVVACRSGETTPQQEPKQTPSQGASAASAGPNVVLVVLDTTRAEAVSAYGLEQAYTPYFDQLATEGERFSQARSTTCWTLPAHASLFTGLYSFQHNAHNETLVLDDAQLTLAELLQPSYETVGFNESGWVAREAGFAQGFDHFEHSLTVSGSSISFLAVQRFIDWYRQRDRSRPFFAFVNLFTTHLPYGPPPAVLRHFFRADVVDSNALDRFLSFQTREARLYMMGRLKVNEASLGVLQRLYLADASFTDSRLSDLLAPLRADGTLDDTLLIVVGDHGESIGEHGLMEHQFALYENVLHVPLVMRWPGHLAAGTVREAPVQLIDIAPTVLDAVGLSPSVWSGWPGTSLLQSDPPPERPVLAEFMRPLLQRDLFARLAPDFDFERFDRRLKSIQVGSLKLIASERGELELYDLAADPEESTNLANDRPADAERLRAQLLDMVGGWEPRTAAPPPELDEQTRRQLRGLGYIK